MLTGRWGRGEAIEGQCLLFCLFQGTHGSNSDPREWVTQSVKREAVPKLVLMLDDGQAENKYRPSVTNVLSCGGWASAAIPFSRNETSYPTGPLPLQHPAHTDK